jgi:hypothetical protein
MKNESVFVLVHTNADYVDIEVYRKREDAIEALKELAEKYEMDLYEESAEGVENYAQVEEKMLF